MAAHKLDCVVEGRRLDHRVAGGAPGSRIASPVLATHAWKAASICWAASGSVGIPGPPWYVIRYRGIVSSNRCHVVPLILLERRCRGYV